jgi:hypothetical protein
METTHKIIISMTSWKKRINTLGNIIYNIIKKQTIKPDIFYLSLSEEEFPLKEKELPHDLLLIIQYFNIKLIWIKKNIYVHKRHEIFKDNNHYNDFIFFFDDDSLYEPTIIENTLKYYNNNKKYDKLIINYVPYDRHYFINKIDKYPVRISTNHIPNKLNAWCGQSCWTPGSYPLKNFQYENERNLYCLKSDECWMLPFILENENHIGNLNYKWPNIISKEIELSGGVNWMNKRINGYTYRELSLKNMCDNIPFIKNIILKNYPEY